MSVQPEDVTKGEFIPLEAWDAVTIPNPLEAIDRESLIYPPDTIVSFTRRLLPRDHEGNEKRSELRRNIVLPLLVQPVTAKLLSNNPYRISVQPCGAPFRSLTFDISTSGLGMVHMRPLFTPYAAVEVEVPEFLDLPPVKVILEIRHCDPLKGTLFSMGGRFVKRFSSKSDIPNALASAET